MSRKPLLKDTKGNIIQAFVPDPAKGIVPIVLDGTIALSTLLDFRSTIAIRIVSTAALTRYFNALSTKTFVIPADTEVIVYLDETVTDVTLTGTATISVEAM